jgi:hypothetical protein
MEQHVFFVFSWYIEGTTEKVLQFIMPLNSIYNKKLGLIEQECIYEHYREVQTIEKSLKCNYFFHEFFFW